MPQPNRLQTLHTILGALLDEIDERYGEGEGKQPSPSDVDLDQALAHAGDIARRLRVDVASLATRPEDRAQGGPEQPAQR
jgi:hypothetical protein